MYQQRMINQQETQRKRPGSTKRLTSKPR